MTINSGRECQKLLRLGDQQRSLFRMRNVQRPVEIRTSQVRGKRETLILSEDMVWSCMKVQAISKTVKIKYDTFCIYNEKYNK